MKIVADLHVHTIASGHAYNTILEMTQSAGEKGLELMAVTDHGPEMPGGPHRHYFSNLRVLPTNINGVEVLKGVEANILNCEGNLDLENRYLEKLDIVLAGFHEDCIRPRSVEDNTATLIKVIQNPFVNVIVHPGNPRFKVDYDRVVAAAADHHVAVEINNGSLTVTREGSEENCREIAKLCKKYRAVVSLGSDAHWHQLVGEFPKAMELLEEAGISEEYVLNTSVGRIKEFLRGKKHNG
ncbi:MAG: phosphatase [Bacillota bacterium]